MRRMDEMGKEFIIADEDAEWKLDVVEGHVWKVMCVGQK